MEKNDTRKINPLDLIDVSMERKSVGEYTFYNDKKR